MAMSKMEQAIYLADNLPQGEYDVDNYEVWAGAHGDKRGRGLIYLEYDRYSNCNVMKIDTDYELLMSFGVEFIRHLLGLLVECRGAVFGAPVSPELAAALSALDDYDPQP